MKLNTNGASKGSLGESEAGGILCDCNSQFILAFARYLGTQTSVFAEPMAILLGLRFAKDLGFYLLRIEIGSLLLVNIYSEWSG